MTGYFDDDEPRPIPETVGELIEEIEWQFDNRPKDKRKRREQAQWAGTINALIKLVNKKAGFTIYKTIKL